MEMQSVVKGKTIKQVKKLNLSGLGLKEIPSYVFQYTNLKKLVLSRNEIVRIPKEIALLRKLEVLDLSYNKIQTLPAPVFRLPKLRVISIGHNRIKRFPSQLIGSHVEHLIADHNRIETIDSKALDNLSRLVISNNPLSGSLIDHPLPKLEYINFSKTNVSGYDLSLLPDGCRFQVPIKQAVITPEMLLKKVVFDAVVHDRNNMNFGSIFISHSSKDGNIIKKFVDEVLLLGVGLTRQQIRCSSIEGCGIKNGADMRNWIHDEISGCSMAFLMISPNYQASQICLNEMGAIWALEKSVKILLLPGINVKKFGWLEEVRQAGCIDEGKVLDELYDTLTDHFGITKNVVTWASKKDDFLSYCKSLPPIVMSQEKNNVGSIYLSYCSKVFEMLNYQDLSSIVGCLVNNSYVSAEFWDRLDNVKEYLVSRASYPGYKALDSIFQSMSILVEDFQNSFMMNARYENGVYRIRQFYKEQVPNPNYDDDLADYIAYIGFIANMAFEFVRLCNAILAEARKLKPDFMADFGIVTISEYNHKDVSVARFLYRENECYEGLGSFVENSDTREISLPYSKERVRKMLRGLL